MADLFDLIVEKSILSVENALQRRVIEEKRAELDTLENCVEVLGKENEQLQKTVEELQSELSDCHEREGSVRAVKFHEGKGVAEYTVTVPTHQFVETCRNCSHLAPQQIVRHFTIPVGGGEKCALSNITCCNRNICVNGDKFDAGFARR